MEPDRRKILHNYEFVVITENLRGHAGQEAAVDAGMRGVYMEVAGILEEVARAQDADDDVAREQVPYLPKF